MSTQNTSLDRDKPADRHAPRAMLHLHGTEGTDGGGDALAYAPDPIEWACCTAEWRDGWRHERSCALRGRAVEAPR